MAVINWTSQEVQQLEQQVRFASDPSQMHPVHHYPQYAVVGQNILAEECPRLQDAVDFVNKSSSHGWLVLQAYPDARRQKMTLFSHGQVPTEWQ